MVNEECITYYLACFFLSLVYLSSAELECGLTNNSASHVFKLLTNKSSYKKWAMPVTENEEPLIVKIKMYIFHINAKETSKLDIKMQVMLELSWKDPRLAYYEISSSLKSITGGKYHHNSIWTPRIIFTNEKDSLKMGTSRKDDFLTILPSGSVLLTTRLSETQVKYHSIVNNIDLEIIRIFVGYYGGYVTYNTSSLRLVWDEDTPLQIGGLANSLMEFDILDLKHMSGKDVHIEPINEQKFSSLIIEMILERHYGYYLLNYYLPSELLVIISWFSFWLDPAIVPARVTLGVSTMLTFIQLDMIGIPRRSDFVANDIWAVTCIAFIFLSLAEFAFVNSIERKQGVEKVHIKKLKTKYIFRGGVDTAAGRTRLRRSSSCPSSPEIRRHFAKNHNSAKTLKELKEISISLGNLVQAGINHEPTTHNPAHSVFTMTPQEIAIWIDVKSRVVFPLAFFIFNFIYWIPLFIV